MPEIYIIVLSPLEELIRCFSLDCQLRVEPWESLDLVRDERIVLTLKDGKWFKKNGSEWMTSPGAPSDWGTARSIVIPEEREKEEDERKNTNRKKGNI